MNDPVWERKRNTNNLVDSITSFDAENMLRLSIAFQSAFGYCVCCQNTVAVSFMGGQSRGVR